MKDQCDNRNHLVDQICADPNEMASSQTNGTRVLKESTNTLSKVIQTRPCEKHEGNMVFCTECNVVCCVQCDGGHSNHEIMQIKGVSSRTRKSLNSGMIQVRTLIRYANIVIKDMNSYLEKLAANLSEICAEIEKRAESLPDGAELAVETLLSDVHDEHTQEQNRIRDKITEFDEFIKKAKTVAVNCENLANASDDMCVVMKGDIVLSSVKNTLSSLPLCPVEKALHILSVPPEPQEGKELVPEEMLGEFCKAFVPWRIEVKRTASFRPETVASSRFVTTMCSAADEKVWVVWQWGPNVYLVDKEGNVHSTFNAGAKVDDICTNNDGNLVISCHEAKCIKVLDSNNQVKKTIEMENIPRGIYCNANSETVVCCVQNLHHRNGDACKVLKIKPESEGESKDLNCGERLIQPWRVAINRNGDICVSDRNKGVVEIFDSDGNFKFSYSGPDTSTRHPFAPHGISCDRYGQIFVVDYTNHTVHVLDPLGRFRGFLIMDTELEKRAIFMGTSSPFSIAIDDVGDVWVGNKFGYLTVLKYFV